VWTSHRPERAVGTPRSFNAFAIAQLDVMPSLQRLDRARHGSCEGVGSRLKGRSASQAGFLR
jgi:hypothetical protein